MSIAIWQELKALARRLEEVEKREPVKPVVEQQKEDSTLVERVTKLENNYRMLNARLSRGKTDG